MSLHTIRERVARQQWCSQCSFPVGCLVIGLVAALSCWVSTSRPASAAARVAEPIAQSRFADQIPSGWQLGEGWAPAGATAENDCRASWNFKVPDRCLVETVFELAAPTSAEKPVRASLAIGPEGDGQIKVGITYKGSKYRAEISAPGADGKPASAAVDGGIQRHPKQLVSLGVASAYSAGAVRRENL